MFFFFNDTATTEIYTLSLHDALPIYAVDVDARLGQLERQHLREHDDGGLGRAVVGGARTAAGVGAGGDRDDLARRAVGDHRARVGAAREEHAAHVGIHPAVPFLDVHVDHGRVRIDPGVGH